MPSASLWTRNLTTIVPKLANELLLLLQAAGSAGRSKPPGPLVAEATRGPRRGMEGGPREKRREVAFFV